MMFLFGHVEEAEPGFEVSYSFNKKIDNGKYQVSVLIH